MKNQKLFNGILGIGMIALLMACSADAKKVDDNNVKTEQTEINKIVGIAKIEPEKGLLNIYSAANGKVNQIMAAENELVSKGAVILDMEKSADLAQLKIQEGKIISQQASIKSAEIKAKITLNDWQNAQKDLAVDEALFNSKAITEKVLKDSKSKVEKLQIEYEKQLAEIAYQKSGMQEINANIAYQKAVLADKNVKAAYDGKVLKWDVHNGDFLTAGEKLGQYAPDGHLVAITEVDELFADRIKTGLKAEVISQVNGKTIGKGEVVFVGGFLKKKSLFSDENTVEDRRVREVKIRLDDNAQVMINNRVDCVIYLNRN
ncbi:HlyD family efflux transporter periplasmic adaptor subunit [Limibacter armeniacum]|uniref:HlyD family secretion protein n=1 Tax=Limibacter armeniacum TaxID=466084 RepID=UPI002FE665E5